MRKIERVVYTTSMQQGKEEVPNISPLYQDYGESLLSVLAFPKPENTDKDFNTTYKSNVLDYIYVTGGSRISSTQYNISVDFHKPDTRIDSEIGILFSKSREFGKEGEKDLALSHFSQISEMQIENSKRLRY